MGGTWASMTDMLLGERGRYRVGASLNGLSDTTWITDLFSENGGYIIAVKDIHLQTVKAILNTHQVHYDTLGKTEQTDAITVSISQKHYVVPLSKIAEAWGHRNWE